MEPAAPKIQRIAFDHFEVDLRSGELLKNGRRLHLQAQPFQLLALLLERPGEVVTREEICSKLWQADTFVDFDHSLGTAINKVREALGDSADRPRFVETLPRRGYRFIGKMEQSNGARGPEKAPSDVNANAAMGSAESGAGSGSAPAVQETGRPYSLKLAIALVVVSMSVLATVVFFRRSEGSHATAGPASITSIAVLPLQNLSGNPAQEYFADGMTDELTTQLARTKGLRVISRTSVMQYKDARRPLKDIARELGVDGILEGSVMTSGDQVRVTVQLVRAASDTHVWAQSYIRNLSDVLLLQQDLAEDVARQVNSAALPPKTSARRIAPEAHDAYLRGRYNWFTSDSNKTIRESFEKAIQLQPDYAAAYSGLADYYIAGSVSGVLDPKDALPKGAVIAQKALQLDDSTEEAHNTMAATYLFYKWDWKAAESEARRAIELNPNYAEGDHLYAYILLALNREDEAVESQRKAQELDPFARPWALGYVLDLAGRYQEAETEFRHRIEASPRNSSLHYQLASCYGLQGKKKESIEEFQEGLRLDGDEKRAAEVRSAFANGGYQGAQEWWIAQLKQAAKTGYVSPLDFAFAYARLGQDNEAFRWLEKAYDDHVPKLVFLQENSDLNPLRGDPRYEALIKRIGLPEAP
jgi:TolB-like protein/DNA-binding winged helix-turn-helix (wHTH) protein